MEDKKYKKGTLGWFREYELTQYEIAEMFGISQTAVSMIINRRTWYHIYDELYE